MEVTVRLFAVLREHAGTGALALELREGATVADAVAVLREGALAGLPADSQFATAVQREIVESGHPLRAGDELALVPPVSGGDGGPVKLATVTGEPLDVEAIRKLVSHPATGATVVFLGTTREVPALEYEAYEEMAAEQIARLAAECVELHGLAAVAVAHRTGFVELMEPSIVVAASSPHRDEAFVGARWLLDNVKAKASIWKKEHPEDGPPEWVEGTLPQPGD